MTTASGRAAEKVRGGWSIETFSGGPPGESRAIETFLQTPPTLSAAGLAQKSDAATFQGFPTLANPIGFTIGFTIGFP